MLSSAHTQTSVIWRENAIAIFIPQGIFFENVLVTETNYQRLEVSKEFHLVNEL